jgi:hypothetical protein
MPQCKQSVAWVLIILALCAIAFIKPASVAAATIELSVPIQSAFDKTKAAADNQTAAKLSTLYKDLSSLLEQDRNIETKIKSLHYRNEEVLLALRKQIREIDADKLSKLEDQVKQTKERYKPLYAMYASVNEQIRAAKYLKNKTLNALLRAEADGLRPAILLARQDIKNKEAALKAGKISTAKTIKAARDTLAAIDPLKVQIKSQRSAASLPRKSLSPVWTNFKYAIKKSEAKSTLDALATLVMLSRQITEQQQKIYLLEVKISDIIVRTKAQFL